MIEIQEAKKRKPKGVQYFTQDTENAINEYNTTTDFELKDKNLILSSLGVNK